jgi:hypothetical protein
MYLFTIYRFVAGPIGVAYVPSESKARIVEAVLSSDMSKQSLRAFRLQLSYLMVRDSESMSLRMPQASLTFLRFNDGSK